MGKPLYQDKGGWFIAYRIPGSRKLIREYFGNAQDSKRLAEIRNAEVSLAKAKGEIARDTSNIYLDQLARHYLDDAKMRGTNDQWREEFRSLLNREILPALTHRPVDQLAYTDVLALASVDPITRRPGAWSDKSAPTVNRYLGYLRAVFRFGIAKGLTKNNPLAAWSKRPERKKDVGLTVDDLRKIIAHGEPHLAWALEVEWNLGCRPGPSELFALKWSDVDFDALTVRVRGTKTETSNRTVPISPDFRARLLIVRQESKSLYIIDYLGKPIKRLRMSLHTACKRAEIGYPVRPYDVRHLFASAMLQGGADLAAVSALLGHASIATTQKHYYHLMQGEKERAIAKLPPIAAPKAGKLVKIK
jgi:integrase